MKNILHSVILFIAVMVLAIPYPVAAKDEQFYSNNDVYFYDPTDTGNECVTGDFTLSDGNDNKQKIWSWLIAKGMSENGAAGIMGNMQVESGFNPFRLQVPDENYDSLVGDDGYNRAYGLVQWDGSRRVEVLKYIAGQNDEYKQYIGGVYGLTAESYKEAPSEVNDAFISIELDFMHTESTPGGSRGITWGKMITAPSPEKAADLFEEIFEGSVREAGGEHSTSARAIYKQFSGSGSLTSNPGSSSCNTSGIETIDEGGLNEEQAKKFMMNYGENKNGDSAKFTGENWDNCNGGGSNCVTFSQFFINKFTASGPRSTMGDGKDVVKNLKEAGTPTGSTMKVFSVFSTPGTSGNSYGHTGIVLGIHGDTVIVGHASCGNSGIGKGNGTLEGGGSGFIKVGKISTADAFYVGSKPTEYAYPKNINLDQIEEYVNGNL